MGSFVVVLKDDCIPMPMEIGHNRLNDAVSLLEPSDISLADVELCPLPPSANRHTSTSIAAVRDHDR